MDLSPPAADPGPVPPPPALEEATGGDRIVGGVAGFVAERLGVDPLWVRIGLVLLALASGIGVLVYAGLWIVLIADRSTNWTWSRYVGGALVVVGTPIALRVAGVRFVIGPVAVIVLLIGLAVALWRPRRPVAAVTRPAATPTWPAPSPPRPERTPRPARVTQRRSVGRPVRRPSSPLGRAALGVSIVVAAVGALIDQVNDGRLHPEQWLGAAAAVCGVGIIIGAVRGRARWLALPALGLAAAGYVSGQAAHLGIAASDLAGQRTVYLGQSSSTDRVSKGIVFGSIDVYIDGAPQRTTTADLHVAFGTVHVWAPDDVTVEIRGHVDHGRIHAPGTRTSTDGNVLIGSSDTPDVIIDGRVGHGSIEVTQFETAGPYATVPTEVTISAHPSTSAAAGTVPLTTSAAVTSTPSSTPSVPTTTTSQGTAP